MNTNETNNRYTLGMDAAAYILAAEVERLRARVAELEGKQ